MDNIKTTHGSSKKVFRGHLYTKHKQLVNGYVRWRCVDRIKRNCKGAIKTDGLNTELLCAHNHTVDHLNEELSRHRTLIKEAAKVTMNKPTVSIEYF